MNILIQANLLKKIAILVVSLGVSYAIAPGAIAQSNPRPTIFNEPPYNRVAPRPEPRRGRHGHPPKPRPPISPQSTNGAPPPRPRYGGAYPTPPAGGSRRNDPRPPRPTNGVPSESRDRVYEAPNPPSNGVAPPPPGSLNAPLRVPSPGSPQ